MKTILDFLDDLRNNNTKEWMDKNKTRFQEARREFESLVSILIDRITLFDDSIAGIQPKNCIFRLNRDIRFSNDKRPYKENMGAFISGEGKKGVDGGYYIHLEPGQSMLAGGSYMPPADVLGKIRQEIDYDPEPLLSFMRGKSFRQYFGDFAGDRLKTAPKGYAADHPNVGLLNLKSLIVTHPLSDKQVTGDNFIGYATEVFASIKPLNDFLKTAIRE
ncbi:MAG: DUF2461 domain-containing protein [Cyclobacteriaceae bacterium]|nr:DUF2461 domain-containing protein [Cyclobacteriaceae bacterium]